VLIGYILLIWNLRKVKEKQMKVFMNQNGHFEDRVDEYLNHFDELSAYSYQEIADLLLEATHEVTLLSGNTYREVTMNGITFGIGYRVYNKHLVEAATVIAPYDVELNSTSWFKGSHKTVTPFIEVI
jgi:hypothetical protein